MLQEIFFYPQRIIKLRQSCECERIGLKESGEPKILRNEMKANDARRIMRIAIMNYTAYSRIPTQHWITTTGFAFFVLTFRRRSTNTFAEFILHYEPSIHLAKDNCVGIGTKHIFLCCNLTYNNNHLRVKLGNYILQHKSLNLILVEYVII